MSGLDHVPYESVMARQAEEAETLKAYPRCTLCGHSGAFHQDAGQDHECLVLRCYCTCYQIARQR